MSEEKKNFNELSDEALEQVSGGAVIPDYNTQPVFDVRKVVDNGLPVTPAPVSPDFVKKEVK